MKAWQRIILIVLGLFMVFSGFYFMSNPIKVVWLLTVLLSIYWLVSGISKVILYFAGNRVLSGWVMADGILSILLGILLVSNQFSGMATILFVFSFWVLFSGIMRIVGSVEVKKLGSSRWSWLLGVGVLEAVIGFATLFNPVLAVIGITAIIVILFLMEGIATIALAFHK